MLWNVTDLSKRTENRLIDKKPAFEKSTDGINDHKSV